MTTKTIIAVLGWEDRFIEGFKVDYQTFAFNKFILFRYAEYTDITQQNYNIITKFCSDNNIEFICYVLSYEKTISNWALLSDALLNDFIEKDEIILEITTIPRELIWTMLFFLKQQRNKVDFVYHKPISYSDDWLSREPDKPRLLLKHSGIIDLGKQTLLFILTGFDPERTRQLINFYEPKKTILVIQSGNQFSNSSRNNVEQHIKESVGFTDYESHEIDSYNLDESYKKIESILDKYKDDYNIVASSLGPKLACLSLYKYHHHNDSIALTYVPCKEYNVNYSKGLNGTQIGNIQFK